ncbi:MAG: prolipoprotein diacylglyceryl transferase [Candidatus Anaerobiospirillum merdipullorum]|uniref:Phosphatidylglycerol--prolipoprotein diacylglyceryl transferase n=1 Tax=Candidatus Anaerobiospirillum merdipullorum TaxID=2838450 RepID=A0A9E2KPJ4_9GAMM|nr:prolipoprotein diacylglyceryl transferase [Candidatus Anaerobiospirillum merdipullorum]
MFYWNADPIALTLGPVALHWYGILFAGGFVLGYLIMQYMYKKRGWDTNELDRLLIFIFVGTVIGARLGHCLIYEPDFYLSHPMEILKIWHGGLASHGGTIGVLVALFIYFKLYKPRYTFFTLADMLCVPIALVCTLIRLGNFMNSEILGIPTDGSWGVIFARLGETFPRHPAQLYEALSYFITFIILGFIYFKVKRRPQGLIFALLFFFIYAARFCIEPFKVEQADYSTHSIFTVGQLLSVPFALGGLLLTIYLLKKGKWESYK